MNKETNKVTEPEIENDVEQEITDSPCVEQNEGKIEEPPKFIEVSYEEYQKLLNVESEMKELKDKMLRTVSEFENSKKRVEKQKEEFVQYALKNVLSDFLPVLENLQLALKSTETNATVESLKQGFEMIGKQVLDVLSNQGLKQMDVQDKPFDPHFHEAIGTVETEDVDEDIVVEVISHGYLYKEMLLKPAMVKVSKKPN